MINWVRLRTASPGHFNTPYSGRWTTRCERWHFPHSLSKFSPFFYRIWILNIWKSISISNWFWNQKKRCLNRWQARSLSKFWMAKPFGSRLKVRIESRWNDSHSIVAKTHDNSGSLERVRRLKLTYASDESERKSFRKLTDAQNVLSFIDFSQPDQSGIAYPNRTFHWRVFKARADRASYNWNGLSSVAGFRAKFRLFKDFETKKASNVNASFCSGHKSTFGSFIPASSAGTLTDLRRSTNSGRQLCVMDSMRVTYSGGLASCEIADCVHRPTSIQTTMQPTSTLGHSGQLTSMHWLCFRRCSQDASLCISHSSFRALNFFFRHFFCCWRRRESLSMLTSMELFANWLL